MKCGTDTAADSGSNTHTHTGILCPVMLCLVQTNTCDTHAGSIGGCCFHLVGALKDPPCCHECLAMKKLITLTRKASLLLRISQAQGGVACACLCMCECARACALMRTRHQEWRGLHKRRRQQKQDVIQQDSTSS